MNDLSCNYFFAIPRRLMDAMLAFHHPNLLSNYHTFFYGHTGSIFFPDYGYYSMLLLWLTISHMTHGHDLSQDFRAQ
jgi:hypothetical protein